MAENVFSLAVLSTPDWLRLGVLFQRVFGHALDSKLADYKYAHGHGESVALVDEEDQVVAHCGMIFRRLLIAGRPSPGAQFGDLMVEPAVRGIGSRQGLPFYRVFTGALQRLKNDTPLPLVFGYPSARATRLGERLGLIVEMDQIQEMVWPALKAPLRTVEQLASPRFAAVVDRLWNAMSQDLADAVVGIRDWTYFERRYFHHPVHKYRVFLLRSRWLRSALGVFVLRSHGDMVELVDWVAPLARGMTVIDQARCVAASMGAQRLVTWQSSAYAHRFAVGTSSCQSMPICAAVGGEIPSQWMEQFKGHMWVTAGDTDYH